MPTAIDVRDLPARLAEALALTAAGQEVLVCDGPQPKARLVPVTPPAGRVPGLHAGALQPADDFDAPLPDDFWAGSF
jgi:antitoxin (DNA-binding transcriptional repressor) of toxin-antitoxin stability system